MGETVTFENRAKKLKEAIENQIGKLGKATPLVLPPPDAEVTELYVQKLEGTYNVARAKKDTDHAIELLYIAYNTTPQEDGQIRVKIAAIMGELIRAQGESEIAMSKAIGKADNILAKIGTFFSDWEDVRKCKGPDDEAGVKEIKTFLTDDIIKLAKYIKAQALEIKTMLEVIAAAYDGIIRDTRAATSASELALAKRLDDAAAIKKQIAVSNAKREQLEALVQDLAREVEKYDKMAKQYEARANTAEERAFIMSIVQVGAQMVAGAIPAIVTALTASATGGASVVASAAVSTVNRAVGDKNATEVKKDPTDEDVIKAKKDISNKAAEAKVLEGKISGLKKDVTDIENELKTQKQKEGKPTDTTTNTAAEDKDDSETVKAIKKRIGGKKEELKTEEDKYASIIGVLSGLQASLTAMEKGLGQMSQKAEDAAASLRKLQMQMLDKVEAYEKERRTQNAELVQIKALLIGSMSEQEIVQLAIQSLNVSLTALKRTQEIIIEIAAFFKSFAAFMDRVSDETEEDITLFDDAAGRPRLRESFYKHLIESTDKFFLRQTAEWNAIRHVSDKFNQSFADGRTKLNKLSGKYIQGHELKAYLKDASKQLEKIVAERETAADAKVVEISGYRKQLTDSAKKTS